MESIISWQPEKKEKFRFQLSADAVRADIDQGILSSNKNTLKYIGSYSQDFQELQKILEEDPQPPKVVLLVKKGGGLAHPIRMRYEKNGLFFFSGYYSYTKAWEGVLNAKVYDAGAFNTFVTDINSLAKFFDGWGIV